MRARFVRNHAVLLLLIAGCGRHELQGPMPDGHLDAAANGGASGGGGAAGGGAAGTPVGGGSGFADTGTAGIGGAGGQGRGGTGGAVTGRGGSTGGTGGAVTGRGGSTGGTGGAVTGKGGSFGGTGETCGGVVPTLPMCPALCGNGVRDTCAAPTRGFCPPTNWTENCDGTDFGTDSCGRHGFAGGALTCAANCAVDDSSCSECMPLDATLVRCGLAPINPVSAGFLAVAATSAEVGLAWVELDATYNATLSFARLTPALDRISVTVLDDHVPPDSYYPALGDLAAAALPSGWVLAIFERSGLGLRAIGADGAETGRALIDPAASASVLPAPLLAERPSGGPLLVWATDTGLRASAIAADGRSATIPVDLPTSDVANNGPPAAAFVGDAFYVVFPIWTLADQPALRIVRVGSNGAIASTIDALPGEEIYMPNLASGASDLRIAGAGPSSGISGDPIETLWWRLGPAGQVLTTRSRLAGASLGVGPSFAFGDDTVVFVVGLDAASISFARVASDGSIVTPPRQIVRAPYLGYRAARRGPDVVVAWGGPGGFQMARVTP